MHDRVLLRASRRLPASHALLLILGGLLQAPGAAEPAKEGRLAILQVRNISRSVSVFGRSFCGR